MSGTVPFTAGGRPTGRSDESWTVYHHDAGGSGATAVLADLSFLRSAWTSPRLDGQLYGEPLVAGTAVYVATEQDWVYALSAADGRVIWSRHLADPVPSSQLPCGDISPVVGVTSTPVIDLEREEIFVVADELDAGTAKHVLYGLNLSDGKTELTENADPPGASVRASLQRASLTLDGSSVVFGYGGNYGDCGAYHGWVVSIPVTGGRPAFFEVDSAAGEREGAIWMGGAAPVVTGNGDIYVATGNGSVTSPGGPYDYGDSVIELSRSLRPIQYFAPGDWLSQNAADEDLGSAAPAVLPDGLVLQAGKSHALYLLDSRRLGGVGGQLAEMKHVCNRDFDGGAAFSAQVVYLPCGSGILAVATNGIDKTMRLLWQGTGSTAGSPILAGGLIWTMSHGILYALRPANGSVERSYVVGQSADHFPTPSFGDGHLFASSDDEVHAFVPR